MKYSPREIRSLSDKKRHAIIGDIAREVRNKRSTIKTLHKVHPLNMTEEEVQLKIQDLTTQIAKADHYRLQLLYPGIEAIYEDRIIEICGKSSVKEMVSNGINRVLRRDQRAKALCFINMRKEINYEQYVTCRQYDPAGWDTS